MVRDLLPRLNRFMEAVNNWNPETDSIEELAMNIEDLYSFAIRNFLSIEAINLCDQIVLAVTSASAYIPTVAKIKSTYIDDTVCVCDTKGFILCATVEQIYDTLEGNSTLYITHISKLGDKQ